MNISQNPIVRAWKWWFTPRSTDPTVVYRERALRFLLPTIALLRMLAIANEYLGFGADPNPPRYFPLQIFIVIFIIPFIFSFYFLAKKQIGMAGACFLLSWYLIDMANLPADGYWHPAIQLSLVIEVILGALLLPTRTIIPFLIFQLVSVGMWGNWLNVNYFHPPLLSTGRPVAVFDRTIYTLAVEEGIVMFICRYLRLEMEKAIRIQQVTIKQLQTENIERKQAELALQQLEDIYRRAINAAGAVPYLLTHNGEFAFTFIGKGILAMTGYSASEWTSGLWKSLIQDGFPRGSLAHLTYEEADRLTNEDHSILWECDYCIRTRDGQIRWIADTSVKSFDEKSEKLVSIGIYQDITERKRTEETQEKLIKELEQRNAELERFTYTVSHDLKSPLVTIKGFLGMLKKDMEQNQPNRIQGDMQRIADAAEKMGSLLSDLLELSRIGRMVNPLEEVDLTRVVNDAIELLDTRIRSTDATVNISPNLPSVWGDRIHLREVFENLIENAVKYKRDQSDPVIEIGQLDREGESVIFVRDNGIGLEEKYQTRIFGLFEKLNPASEGTGIGLALVKRIIEVHGGRIWVESDGLGKGSTFCFTIPDGRKSP